MSTTVGFALGVLLGACLGACAVGPVLLVRLRGRGATAVLDDKTGLPNAAAFRQRATQECSRAGRDQSSLAVLMIDIDNFKQVNDRYGHLVGDGVLADVAGQLAAAVRTYDLLARFGGDEFVALLPGTSPAAAITVAERLRARVGTHRIEDDLTVSIGIATAPAHGTTTEQLLEAADRALYDAKRAGGNHVRIAAGQPKRGDEPR